MFNLSESEKYQNHRKERKIIGNRTEIGKNSKRKNADNNTNGNMQNVSGNRC